MRLKQLFKDIPVTWKGSKETEVSAITANSKSAAPGALFIARRGKAGDGHRFIADAVSAGAAAILTDSYDPFLAVPQIIHLDVNSLESLLACRFYHDPASKLSIFAVTGTSGKTTTTFLLHYLLEGVSGLIGTVNWMTGNRVLPASHTTPDLLTLTQLFHEMVEAKCKAVVMEVSSHALDQGRVADVPFKAAIYTNLSQDHLDYHSSMEEYAAVKSRLFANLGSSGIAIINGDDAWSAKMVENCSAKIIRYGLQPGLDLHASHLELSSQGMKFNVHWQGQTVPFRTQLIGRFNVYNILAAAAVALTEGMTLEAISKKLESFAGVPGRLERVANPKNLQVFVDYSHKPDALKNVLQTLTELKKGRLITVFGCGGNRDIQKRPQMAAISESLSDLTIVTNDNPRNEDPLEIAKQIVSGFQNKSSYFVELDRKKAIEQALHLAKPDDIILIAGKGHETYQVFAHQTISFDDKQIVKEACSR